MNKYGGNTFQLVKPLKIKSNKNDSHLSNNLVYLNNEDLCQLIKGNNKDFNLKPWKYRIVKITNKIEKHSIYRIAYGASSMGIKRGHAMLNFRSLNQLNIDIDKFGIFEIEIFTGMSILYRHYYYFNHLDDQVRISYKLAFWGLTIGILGTIIGKLPF
ncbi:MAG: hypothetical protein KA369_03645 [Spirochaetes bacterium]|nr:hypothetical protein [Spirochaetota bacterium]